jgi:hypothetical protein
VVELLGGTIGELATDPLSGEARSHRRGVLITSAVALLIILLDLVPREISAVGVNLEANDQRGVVKAMMALLAYFTLMFLVYATIDFLAWQKTRRDAKIAQTRTAQEINALTGRLEELLGAYEHDNPERRKETASQVNGLVLALVDQRLSWREFFTFRHITTIRELMDSVFPLALAAWAFYVMAGWLW